MQSRVKVMQQVIFGVLIASIFTDLGFHHPDGLESKVTVAEDNIKYQF